ncbi:MAG: hypothetical protein KJN64_15575 [Ignavibacteria bacterium]|nr:hypothetical protein [Ignavibacteria bacterium]MBT8382450.1 hypothetical protein [Ignavibacteria bacterium]MBT8392827.1 hypothetical protein [Ignavibacteria bacterium]NNJ53605.1 hypothetical protein [Ignavibacteriaceae bacterium]NNL20212.1 hypothetical protein [Ignavibacteriaceae bacterium]
MKIKIYLIEHLVWIILLSGCIEDNISPPLTGKLDSVAEMLIYFESQGDFPNSDFAPALVEAEEIFINLNSFLIIDIRPSDEFLVGHIENAVNVISDSLFDYVEKNYNSGYPKIAIVSKNGQSSAYYTCLLRLAGFNNVYSMNFGMAAWNEVFADEWLGNIGDDEGVNFYTNYNFEKNEFNSLPQFSVSSTDESIVARVRKRIKEILIVGFTQNIIFTNGINTNLYMVCYGKRRLYNAAKNGVFGEKGHPFNTASYHDSPLFELRSNKYLQTLPNSEKILIYDYNGQLGACMTAYLRVLGYDVKFLKFGANRLFYSRLLADPELSGFAFTPSIIKGYPFVGGQ